MVVFEGSAHVYDLIYEAVGKDYAAEARDLDALIQTRNPGATSLLDVACGTGGHLARLHEHYEVTGVDLDPGMLDEARRKLPEVALVEADMRSFRLGRRFDAVICLFSSIGYMPTTSDLDAAITNMAAHLDPGGVLVVDGWVRPDAWRGPVSTHVETATSDTLKVARCGVSRREANKTFLEIHHLVASAVGVEHLVNHHELTLFTPHEYEAAFARAVLSVETIASPLPDRDRYIGTKS